MARLPRLFIPGCPQHIMQRGHNGMAVFLDDQDRQHYLAWLSSAMAWSIRRSGLNQKPL